MFLINGSIKYSDINYRTNSFYIYHDFGNIKSFAKSFSFEEKGVIEQFRPASVVFGEGFIKISLGTYRFNPSAIIRYSFNAFAIKEMVKKYTSEELFAKLKVIETSLLFAKIIIKQVIPGDVIVKSDIEFDVIQPNCRPKFYWDTPSIDSDNSNSISSSDISIIGYYYSFNKIPNYFITKADSFIGELDEPNSTHIFIDFPSSGEYYFHIKAENSVGEISRNTTHVRVIYNNPPRIPTNLNANGYGYYKGASNINIFSWDNIIDSDGDSTDYEIKVYKGNSVIFHEYINALKSCEKELFAKMFIDSNSSSESFSYSNKISDNKCHVFNVDMPITKKRSSDKLYYIFKHDGEKNGNYSYSVRAYDWAEQSEWSSVCYYDIYEIISYLHSKVWLGYNFEENFGKKPIYGKLFIYGESWFFGKIYIVPELVGRLGVCQQCIDANPLYSTLRFKYYNDMYASVIIDTNFSDVYGKLNITDIQGSSTLSSVLKIVEKYDNFNPFYAKLNICYGYQDYGFLGEAYIKAVGKDYIYGALEVIKERFYGKLIVDRIFSNDNDYDKYILQCKMNVDNYPPSPKITCTEGHDWQENSYVTFYWTIDESEIKVVSYEYYVSTSIIKDFSRVPFITTTETYKSINLANYNEDDEYYFYVRSISYSGSVSIPSVYVVRYNHIPSIPHYPMYINNKECISDIPVASSSSANEFKWPNSSHEDNDIVNYNIQVSNKSDFSNIIIDIDNIKDNDYDDFVKVNIIYEYNPDYIYYWRVRAYDRHQYSSFGYVGRFRCNTRPGVPSNLSVNKRG
jgi:hypothetical protein